MSEKTTPTLPFEEYASPLSHNHNHILTIKQPHPVGYVHLLHRCRKENIHGAFEGDSGHFGAFQCVGEWEHDGGHDEIC